MTTFSKIDYAMLELDRMIAQQEIEANKLIENVRTMGAAYAVGWAERALKSEAEASVAREAKKIFEMDGPEKMVAHLLERALAQLSFLIPDSSNIAADTYRAQAYGKLYSNMVFLTKAD